MLDGFIRKEIVSQISPDAKKDDVSMTFKTSSTGAKIKFDTEIITIVELFLNKKINQEYKNLFYYAIEGGIDSSNELNSSILVFYMQKNSDFDVDSIYLAVKKLLRKCLRNIIDISDNYSGNLHGVKVIYGDKKLTVSPNVFIANSEDEVLLTQSLLYNVLGRSKNNCIISFKIDEEYFDLNLRRSSNAPIESEKNNQINCVVLCVDDHSGNVTVRGKDIKGIKKYQFDPQHRQQLLESQLASDELIIDVITMEKFSEGELFECGGRITNIKVVEYEKLI